MTVYEGGTRVRAFIQSKDISPYVYEGMFHAVDWMPTILAGAIGTPVGEYIFFLFIISYYL